MTQAGLPPGGLPLGALVTPALVLDRARLEASCARMREVVTRRGARLRPHLKTAKCREVADAALGDGPGRGIAVATLDEAAYFAARGFADLLLAVGVVPDKVPSIAAIQRGGARVAALVEDPANAAAVAERARTEGTELAVFVEVDSGQGRGGHAPADPALVEVARVLDGHPATTLAGVLTHAGHSYGARSLEARRAIAEAERAAAVAAAEAIRAAGMACPEVSVGSTPTALAAGHLDGVTEVRAGVYVFFDRFQAALGTCARDELALSIVASVIARREPASVSGGAAWIDAGTLALSSERSLEAFGDASYGEVTALDGAPLPGLPRVDALNQEHGRVTASEGALGALRVGDKVRVWPNHACITAAMFDRYHVLEGARVTGTWERLRG